MKPGNNNWLLFPTMAECGLKEFDEEWNLSVVKKVSGSHRAWYKGDDVYRSGAEFHLDYYSSYVIHPLLLQVLKIMIKYDSSFLSLLDEEQIRFMCYVEIQERMITPDGSYPVLERSTSYRPVTFQVLGACALFQRLLQSLKPGQVRRTMTTMLKHLFEQPGTFDKDGWLTTGACGEQKKLGNTHLPAPYVCLCPLAFPPLGLPANNSSWYDPVEPWTSVKAFSGLEFPIDELIKS